MLSTKKLEKIHAKGVTIGQWQKRRNTVTKTLSVVLAITILFGGSGAIFKAFNLSTPTVGEESTTDLSFQPPVANEEALRVFIPAAKAAGWSSSQLKIGEQVNTSLDLSESGMRPFYDQGFKTAAEAIAWLKAGSIEAQGVIVLIKAYTGCTEEELFNELNWVVSQPTVSFTYKEMTLYENGKILTEATRKGNADDIFLSFVAPRSDKIAIIRSGCANPTLFIPVPDEPFVPTETTITIPPDTTATPIKTTGEDTTVTKPGETTIPGSTKPATTKPATTKGKDKDPAKDVLVNPAVAEWKKNGGELIAKLWDSAASNGYQFDPIKEAAEKAAAITTANKFLEEQHSSAVTSAVKVDDNQEHGAIVTDAPTTDSSGATVLYSPFD